VIGHEREWERGERHKAAPGDDDRPAADAVNQRTADRQHQRGPDALWGEQQAGHQRALAAVHLVVEREHQQRAEQRGTQDEGRRGGRTKPA
jgi:hypothetical protein